MNMGTRNALVALCIRRTAFVLALCLLAAYFYFGGRPEAAGALKEPYDKLAHFGLFAVITTLLSAASGCRNPWTVLAAVAFIAIVDEWRQSLLPGRFADPMDIAADLFAAGVVVLVMPKIVHLLPGFIRGFNRE